MSVIASNLNAKLQSNVLTETRGPLGGADLRLSIHQPDTSLHCETMYTGLVHRVLCLFTFQPLG